ncbi:MAG: DUF4388 domain-containing protein [Actinomycetota bacterium]|nr:MAG: DUF4388 domain-containing protein [Actinomycetota bacterium]
MLLQGNLKEFSLPNIFQLVKMSAKSGALTIRRDEAWGKIYFTNGLINYAFSVPQQLPLGERLVQAGLLKPAQLKQALSAQKKAGKEGPRIGTILLEKEFMARATLEEAVREQIQDAAFDFFSWADGEFSFSAEERPDDQDVLVEMNVENVIMEGCRRIDEWELIFEHLGSLERIPHLAYNEGVEDRGEVRLTPDEWRVVVHIDGRADINTILRDCGLDRFHGAKVIYSLFSSGLVTVSEPVIDGIAKGVSVCVRGPIDFYNEVFLTTLTDSNVTKQLRVELIDEKEVEVPIVAGTLTTVEGESEDADELVATAEVLVYTSVGTVSEAAWARVARDASAFVVLVNANDADSLRAGRRDVDFVKKSDGLPFVVATYTSMAEDAVEPDAVRKALGVDHGVPVHVCSLRDRTSVIGVVRAAVDLARGA